MNERTEQAMREAFEVEHSKISNFSVYELQFENGKYLNPFIQAKFNGWILRAAQASIATPQPQSVRDALEKAADIAWNHEPDNDGPIETEIRALIEPLSAATGEHECVYENGDGVCRECQQAVTGGQESEAQAWLIEKVLIDGTSEIEPLYLAAWSHHGQLDEGGYEVVFTKNPHKAIRFDSEKKARGLMHIAENLKATSHIFESEAQAVSPDWYQNPTDEQWFEHPADANLLEGFVDGLKVGDEYEVDVCWNGKQTFRVTYIDDSGDIEAELIGGTQLFAAPPSAIAIESAAKLQAAEVCQDYATAAIAHDFTIAADSYWAIRRAILATIPQDGITELEKLMACAVEEAGSYGFDKGQSDEPMHKEDLIVIVKSLIGDKHG